MSKEQSIGTTGAYTQAGIPVGYTTLTPFLAVSNPTEAINFYKEVFKAKVCNIMDYEDNEGNKIILHAELDFGNGRLQLGSANPDYHLILPPDGDNVSYSMGIYVTNVDLTFEAAVARGAKVREAVTDFISGDRYGSIKDPFGVRWSIMTRTQDLSEEESSSRVREWMGRKQ